MFAFANERQLTICDACSEPGVYNLAVDVSSYAGQDSDLSFTAFHLGPYVNGAILDTIRFSAVTEPSAWSMFVLAGGIVWLSERQWLR